MARRILVTGGAGFIGMHIVRHLLEKKYEVIVFDALDPQVHGITQNYASVDNKGLQFLKADVRDRESLKKAVSESDAIIHLAARVGVGQSMYEVERYVDNNSRGTACLLDILVNEEHDINKVVVASSMSVYGEGGYWCPKCETDVYPDFRSEQTLKDGQWEHLCPTCNAPLIPQPTHENTPLRPTSIYGMSKRHQEEMSLLIGKTYGIPTVALRFFNVYGPGQALSNPYTGCIAIFSSRIMNNKSPIVFEDGKQLRDFIYVDDVARANVWSLENHRCDYQAVNVGTGKPTSILDIARTLLTLFNNDVSPSVTNQNRVGDIRHCYADTHRIEKAGFRTIYGIEEGLKETIEWASKQTAQDLSENAMVHLRSHGLIKNGDKDGSI